MITVWGFSCYIPREAKFQSCKRPIWEAWVSCNLLKDALLSSWFSVCPFISPHLQCLLDSIFFFPQLSSLDQYHMTHIQVKQSHSLNWIWTFLSSLIPLFSLCFPPQGTGSCRCSVKRTVSNLIPKYADVSMAINETIPKQIGGGCMINRQAKAFWLCS